MKKLVSWTEFEDFDEETHGILVVCGYALTPQEHQDALLELAAERVGIVEIDNDSVRGTLEGDNDSVQKAIANLSAKGWRWYEEER